MASSGCPWSSASSLKSAAAAAAGDGLAQSVAAALSIQVSVSTPEAELLLGERRTPPPEEVSRATGCPRWLLVLHRRWSQIDESWSSRLVAGLLLRFFFVLVFLAKNHTKISTTVCCSVF